MISPEIYRAVKLQAAVHNVPIGHLLAFVEVETNGDAFDPVAGQDRALIRWEGHYFRDRLQNHPKALSDAIRTGLAGGPQEIANPRDQEDRYAILEDAANLCRRHGLDPDIAYECVSIGLGQVMGAHARKLGYPSAKAMLDSAHDDGAGQQDIEDQIEMVMRFLVANRLLDDLRAGRWKALARGYNGRNYAKNRYDVKLAAAARRYTEGDASTENPTLRVNRGPAYAVQELQRLLKDRGYFVGAIDGIFGRQTKHQVLAFQSDHDLTPDGIVGPKTWEALLAADSVPIAPERRNATVDDLRAKGSETIQRTDKLQKGAAVVVGAGGLGALTEAVEAIEGTRGLWDRAAGSLALDSLSGVLEVAMPFALLAVGAYVLYESGALKRIRLRDHQSGQHTGR